MKVCSPELNLFANVCVSSACLGQRPRIWSIRFVSLRWRLRPCCICRCLTGRRLSTSSHAGGLERGRMCCCLKAGDPGLGIYHYLFPHGPEVQNVGDLLQSLPLRDLEQELIRMSCFCCCLPDSELRLRLKMSFGRVRKLGVQSFLRRTWNLSIWT